jgi:hypothetical protein
MASVVISRPFMESLKEQEMRRQLSRTSGLQSIRRYVEATLLKFWSQQL